jgi:hypothetical protein
MPMGDGCSAVPPVVEATVDEDGINWYAIAPTATTPSTAATIVFLRFSVPSFTYAPAFR